MSWQVLPPTQSAPARRQIWVQIGWPSPKSTQLPSALPLVIAQSERPAAHGWPNVAGEIVAVGWQRWLMVQAWPAAQPGLGAQLLQSFRQVVPSH
jgi:hypothetical protein